MLLCVVYDVVAVAADPIRSDPIRSDVRIKSQKDEGGGRYGYLVAETVGFIKQLAYCRALALGLEPSAEIRRWYGVISCCIQRANAREMVHLYAKSVEVNQFQVDTRPRRRA